MKRYITSPTTLAFLAGANAVAALFHAIDGRHVAASFPAAVAAWVLWKLHARNRAARDEFLERRGKEHR